MLIALVLGKKAAIQAKNGTFEITARAYEIKAIAKRTENRVAQFEGGGALELQSREI